MLNLKNTYLIIFFLTLSFAFVNISYGQEKRRYLLERFEGIKEIITKNTTQEKLNDIKHNLERQGVFFSYTNLKYNSKKEIIRINIQLKNRKSNFSGEWSQKNNPIPTIKIGEDNGIITAITITKNNNPDVLNNTP